MRSSCFLYQCLSTMKSLTEHLEGKFYCLNQVMAKEQISSATTAQSQSLQSPAYPVQEDKELRHQLLSSICIVLKGQYRLIVTTRTLILQICTIQTIFGYYESTTYTCLKSPHNPIYLRLLFMQLRGNRLMQTCDQHKPYQQSHQETNLDSERTAREVTALMQLTLQNIHALVNTRNPQTTPPNTGMETVLSLRSQSKNQEIL